MKHVALIALVLGGCATPFERCEEIDKNPYGLTEDYAEGDVETRRAKFEELRKEREPKMGFNEFLMKVKRSTTFRWNRYGSMEACVASLDAEDQALAGQINGLFDAAAQPRGATVTQAVGVVTPVSVPPTKDLTVLRECLNYCDKVAEFKSQCVTRCYQ